MVPVAKINPLFCRSEAHFSLPTAKVLNFCSFPGVCAHGAVHQGPQPKLSAATAALSLLETDPGRNFLRRALLAGPPSPLCVFLWPLLQSLMKTNSNRISFCYSFSFSFSNLPQICIPLSPFPSVALSAGHSWSPLWLKLKEQSSSLSISETLQAGLPSVEDCDVAAPVWGTLVFIVPTSPFCSSGFAQPGPTATVS